MSTKLRYSVGQMWRDQFDSQLEEVLFSYEKRYSVGTQGVWSMLRGGPLLQKKFSDNYFVVIN